MLGKVRAVLNFQTVQRDVLGCKTANLNKRFFKAFFGLVGDSVHNVKADIFKSRIAPVGDRLLGVDCLVQPPK